MLNEKICLTVEETAQILNIPVLTVYKLARQKKIPSFKVGGLVRFSSDAINELIKGNSGIAEKG